jgi:hypothetical protein
MYNDFIILIANVKGHFSLMVEHPTFNRTVVGSSPASANHLLKIFTLLVKKKKRVVT